jgi:hypothetical protein
MAEDGVEVAFLLRGDMVGDRVVGARFVGSGLGEADVAGFSVEKVTVSGDDAVRDRVVVGTPVGTDVEGAVGNGGWCIWSLRIGVADDRGVEARVVRVGAEGTSVAVVGVEGANV